MSIRIQIGKSERAIEEIEPNWITEQINRRRHEDVPVCVRITINTGSINLSLATSDCPKSSASSRKPNTQENEIFDLWERLHLNNSGFSPGNLVAFIKQLRN